MLSMSNEMAQEKKIKESTCLHVVLLMHTESKYPTRIITAELAFREMDFEWLVDGYLWW